MERIIRWAVLGCLSTGVALAAGGQSSGKPQPLPESGYTLHAHVRVVLTDVTVLDKSGNPVRGLKQSDFHLFDNNRPQKLQTFEEHTGLETEAPLPETPPGVFTNADLLHPPSVFNVIVLDTATLGVVDQMFLAQELDQLIKNLPADKPMAIFARGNEHVMMVCNLTADHQKLLDAVRHTIPRLRMPGWQYASDTTLFEEIATYLQQWPGRKNILWFTGASGLSLRPDPTSFTTYVDLRPMYDLLQSARIALYPIDARGLMVNDSAINVHMLMEEEAEATGGQAMINTNGIAAAAKRIADTDASFYTLTYSPQDVKLDNKWHKVKIEVDGGQYQLSYRRGYFDDGSNLEQSHEPGRKRLLRDGVATLDMRMEPIIFTVAVHRADPAAAASLSTAQSARTAPKHGERAYALHCSIPVDAFPRSTEGDQDKVTLGLGVLAFNQFGRAISHMADQVTLSVSQNRLKNAPPGTEIGFDQRVNLPDGNDSLYVAVWNMQNGRVGTVQIPVAVSKK